MNSPCPYICNNKTEYGYCKTTGCINPKIIKDVFYDGYAYCLMDFGKDTVLCKDCKHQERIAGYSDYQPNTVFCNKWEHLTDIQGYCYKGERKDKVEE